MPPDAAHFTVTELPSVTVVAETVELFTRPSSGTGGLPPSDVKVFVAVAVAPFESVMTHLRVCLPSVVGVHATVAVVLDDLITLPSTENSYL